MIIKLTMVTEKYLHDYHIGDIVEAEVTNTTQQFHTLGYVSEINTLYITLSNVFPQNNGQYCEI